MLDWRTLELMTVAISKAFYAIVRISTAPGHHVRCESFPEEVASSPKTLAVHSVEHLLQ
jgi:hypothetical protein